MFQLTVRFGSIRPTVWEVFLIWRTSTNFRNWRHISCADDLGVFYCGSFLSRSPWTNMWKVSWTVRAVLTAYLRRLTSFCYFAEENVCAFYMVAHAANNDELCTACLKVWRVGVLYPALLVCWYVFCVVCLRRCFLANHFLQCFTVVCVTAVSFGWNTKSLFCVVQLSQLWLQVDFHSSWTVVRCFWEFPKISTWMKAN